MTALAALTPHTLSQLAPGRTRTHLAWIAAALMAAFLGRAAFLSAPFGDDPAVFILLGRVVSQNAGLYHEVFDTKPPGVALLMAGLWRLFGPWWPGYVLLQMATAAASALLLARTAGRFIHPRLTTPVFAFALIYLNFHALVFSGFQLETLQAFAEILAASAALAALADGKYRHSFLAGLAAGAACMFKPTGAAPAFSLFILLLLNSPKIGWKRTTAHIASLAAGGLIFPAIVFAWVFSAGLLPRMPEVMRQIRLYTEGTPLNLGTLIKLILLAALFGFPILARMRFDRHNPPPAAIPASARRFILLWAILSAAGVLMGRRMYTYHFLVLVPPLALIYGALPRPTRLGPMLAGLAPIAALSLLMSCPGVSSLANGGGAPLPISQYLAAHAEKGDAVWADPMPRIALESGLRAGGSIPSSFYWENHDAAPTEFIARLISDFDQRHTRFIILPVDLDERIAHEIASRSLLNARPLRRERYLAAWADLKSYVADHYDFKGEIDGQVIWQRYPGE